MEDLEHHALQLHVEEGEIRDVLTNDSRHNESSGKPSHGIDPVHRRWGSL